MNREEKSAVITELAERLSGASLGVVTEYRGLTVAQLNKLRRELQGVGASYRVSKNTLTRRAIKETAFAKLDELLRGPTGLVTTGKDPVAVAKILVKFAEQNDKLKISGGVLDGEALPASGVNALAKLPSREVLLGQVIGTLIAPMTQFLAAVDAALRTPAVMVDALERERAQAS